MFSNTSGKSLAVFFLKQFLFLTSAYSHLAPLLFLLLGSLPRLKISTLTSMTPKDSHLPES